MSSLDAVWAPIGAVLTAFVSALVVWLVAKRKGSGTVQTSEAAELWTANQEFRNMLLEEARARTAENKALREEAAKCHEEQAEMKRRLEAMEKELERLRSVHG